jgi:hypothetical protein
MVRVQLIIVAKALGLRRDRHGKYGYCAFKEPTPLRTAS